MQHWTAENIPDQTGKIAIVTGANSGLGYETTLALARKNATVIMACRNPSKAQAAYEQIRQAVPQAKLDVMALDLGDLQSVRDFVTAFSAKYDQLDMLINNAGIMAVPYGVTKDGFEQQLGVNHLGHFALTALLMPMLADNPGSRVVNVSSSLHVRGEFDFNNIDLKQGYGRWTAYGRSKLANILFTFELQRRLDAAGVDVMAVATHPGYADTELQLNVARTSSPGGVIRRFSVWATKMVNRLFAQPAEVGVRTQLYAATAPDAQPATFIGPAKGGYPAEERAKSTAYDVETARRLWEVSEQLTGIHFELPRRDTAKVTV